MLLFACNNPILNHCHLSVPTALNVAIQLSGISNGVITPTSLPFTIHGVSLYEPYEQVAVVFHLSDTSEPVQSSYNKQSSRRRVFDVEIYNPLKYKKGRQPNQQNLMKKEENKLCDQQCKQTNDECIYKKNEECLQTITSHPPTYIRGE